MINLPDGLKSTPWDSRVFPFDTYEIFELNAGVLDFLSQSKGHYTIKLNPLNDSRELLSQLGFYYCDTLIEPYIARQDFKPIENQLLSIAPLDSLDEILPMVDGMFNYDRFHRDFNIKPDDADIRYKNWLMDIMQQHTVYALISESNKAGFIACIGNKLVLHGIAKEYRGKKLAKYFWSQMCQKLFEAGHDRVESSVSSANLAIVNLYISLGFKFQNPVNIYHKIVN